MIIIPLKFDVKHKWVCIFVSSGVEVNVFYMVNSGKMFPIKRYRKLMKNFMDARQIG